MAQLRRAQNGRADDDPLCSPWHAPRSVETTDAHVGVMAPPRDGAQHRTTQSVPPAVRRRVLHRDDHVCRAPGCRNTL